MASDDESRSRNTGFWLLVLVALAGATFGWWLVSAQGVAPPLGERAPERVSEPLHAEVASGKPKAAEAPAAEATAARSDDASSAPASAQPEVADLLEDSDRRVRELLAPLASGELVDRWLEAPQLVRTFVVSMANLSDGLSPGRHLRFMRPARGFSVIEEGQRSWVDPASFDRYDDLVAIATSLNPESTASVYEELYPLFSIAYAELGYPDQSFEVVVLRAFQELLSAPLLEGPAELVPVRAGHGYADPELEDLSGAQKHLLRMGPENQRAIQAQLRAIANALGLPADELPETPVIVPQVASDPT